MIRLCASDELAESRSRGFNLDDLHLLVVRKDGQVHAYRNRCPHRGVSLQWQPDDFLDDSASLIRCATHGALFLIDSGECVAGPCAGQALQALPCREEAGSIWLLGSES
ncbi:Rieske (2Fe-2S) protein [Pseudomonas sp. AA-38]|uniref:Rieske (2Fe-2S) protein n=1 Tax=Pseudomonas sp. AA-38 TaxID=3028807 RepID=UPI0023F9613A|nr:Rieske (2Fe-2S) protein [Pseudomonas sp. AA-38]